MVDVEVITFHGGCTYDKAQADTPEAALVAARTLLDDYMGVDGHHRRDFSVGFYVEGRLSVMAGAQDIAPLSDEEIALAILRKQGKLA